MKVVFPGKGPNQRIHVAVLMLKSSFYFFGAIMKCQKCSESEALLEIEEILWYAYDQMAYSKAN